MISSCRVAIGRRLLWRRSDVPPGSSTARSISSSDANPCLCAAASSSMQRDQLLLQAVRVAPRRLRSARPRSPSTSRSSRSWPYRNRTTNSSRASSVAAPMTPPVTLLSSPMIAFCTVFDSVSSTTRSNGLSCASSRLPASRRPMIEEDVDQDRPQHLLGERQRRARTCREGSAHPCAASYRRNCASQVCRSESGELSSWYNDPHRMKLARPAGARSRLARLARRARSAQEPPRRSALFVVDVHGLVRELPSDAAARGQPRARSTPSCPARASAAASGCTSISCKWKRVTFGIGGEVDRPARARRAARGARVDVPACCRVTETVPVGVAAAVVQLRRRQRLELHQRRHRRRRSGRIVARRRRVAGRRYRAAEDDQLRRRRAVVREEAPRVQLRRARSTRSTRARRRRVSRQPALLAHRHRRGRVGKVNWN